MNVEERIRIRDLNTCVYCGEFAETIDHIYPQSLGGSNKDNNLVCCCRKCNAKKAKNGQFLPEMMVRAFRYLRSIGVEIA